MHWTEKANKRDAWKRILWGLIPNNMPVYVEAVLPSGHVVKGTVSDMGALIAVHDRLSGKLVEDIDPACVVFVSVGERVVKEDSE